MLVLVLILVLILVLVHPGIGPGFHHALKTTGRFPFEFVRIQNRYMDYRRLLNTLLDTDIQHGTIDKGRSYDFTQL